MRASGGRSVSIYPILSVNFVGTLGFSIVLPFLVFLVTRWGGNALIYGIVGATYSVFQLLGAPILGRWSDVYGRRKILLVSQLGTLVSWLIFAVAFALPSRALVSWDSTVLGQFTLTLPLLVLFLARALDGLTGGNVSVANAYLADITPESDRNANFGKMAVSANVGFILGPAIAGVLGGTSWGELLPVLAALGISVVATLMILLLLPESNPREMESDPEQANVRQMLGQDQERCFEMRAAERHSLREIIALPHIAPLLGIYFLVMLGFNFFYIAFPVYAVQGLEWSVRETGIFFSVLSVVMAIVQGPILGAASRRWTDAALAIVGSGILAASFVFFVSHRIALIYAGVGLLALGNGLMWPSVVSVLSKAAGDRYQGAVQGVASSCGAIASIVGLVVGGALFEFMGSRIFFLSAGIIFVVFWMSFGMRRWEGEGVTSAD